jgi:hypothetical protein
VIWSELLLELDPAKGHYNDQESSFDHLLIPMDPLLVILAQFIDYLHHRNKLDKVLSFNLYLFGFNVVVYDYDPSLLEVNPFVLLFYLVLPVLQFKSLELNIVRALLFVERVYFFARFSIR